MQSKLKFDTLEIFKNGHNASVESRDEIHAFVKNFYEKIIKTNKDFEQGTCCIPGDNRIVSIYELLPDELLQHNYGCGSTIPFDDLTGLTVADWGCGSGVDCFTLAHLVGPSGKVIGIDMSEEQLKRADRFTSVIMKAFNYPEPNVDFRSDYIELGDSIEDDSVDLVVSNCVINLSPRKDQVFGSIARKLKEGGELYFSDVVLDRRLPFELFDDPQIFARLLGECVGGALYIDDLMERMKAAGFSDPRIVSQTQINDEVEGYPVGVYSAEIRAFKISEPQKSPVTEHLPPMDTQCEDYGQTATYNGILPYSPARFTLDDHHVFERNKPESVCRNTARMLSDTRLSRYFKVTEPISHYGRFPCDDEPAAKPKDTDENNPGACC